jgi:DNA-binding response OmpR family regulator
VTAALTRGADDVLLKPVDVATVVDTVNKHVERGRRQQNT